MTEQQTISELKRQITKLKIERDALQTELNQRIILEARMVAKTLSVFENLGIDGKEVLKIYGAD